MVSGSLECYIGSIWGLSRDTLGLYGDICKDYLGYAGVVAGLCRGYIGQLGVQGIRQAGVPPKDHGVGGDTLRKATLKHMSLLLGLGFRVLILYVRFRG